MLKRDLCLHCGGGDQTPPKRARLQRYKPRQMERDEWNHAFLLLHMRSLGPKTWSEMRGDCTESIRLDLTNSLRSKSAQADQWRFSIRGPPDSHWGDDKGAFTSFLARLPFDSYSSHREPPWCASLLIGFKMTLLTYRGVSFLRTWPHDQPAAMAFKEGRDVNRRLSCQRLLLKLCKNRIYVAELFVQDYMRLSSSLIPTSVWLMGLKGKKESACVKWPWLWVSCRSICSCRKSELNV